MARYKLTLEYDGTDFAGWQRQAEGITTVQSVLEQAIKKFSGEAVTLHVAGRTDAGVHAVGQVAHADLVRDDVPEDTMRDAVNFYVRPHRVVVIAAERVDESFHARFSAIGRAYRYVIINRRPPPVLDAAYSWHVHKPLEVAAMHDAAQQLLGQHDFSTFRAQHCQATSPIKTIDAMTVVRDGEKLILTVRARSFLYHQVRNIAGTLMLVGTGQWSQDDFALALAACDRTRGGPTAPPQGLCFLGPRYAGG